MDLIDRQDATCGNLEKPEIPQHSKGEAAGCNLDCISRQAAKEALDALCDRECEYSKKQRSVMCGACHLGTAFEVIEQLPSAQQEPCKDAVSRAEIIRLILERGLYCDTQADRETSAEIIRRLPSAQPEIIHCRDCRYENMGECEHKFGLLVANDENYCSYAERKEEHE